MSIQIVQMQKLPPKIKSQFYQILSLRVDI